MAIKQFKSKSGNVYDAVSVPTEVDDIYWPAFVVFLISRVPSIFYIRAYTGHQDDNYLIEQITIKWSMDFAKEWDMLLEARPSQWVLWDKSLCSITTQSGEWINENLVEVNKGNNHE